MKKRIFLAILAISLLACCNNRSFKKVENPSPEPILGERTMNMDSYQSKYRGKKCSVQGPHDSQPCKCSGFDASNRDASVCRKCGHKAIKHTR